MVFIIRAGVSAIAHQRIHFSGIIRNAIDSQVRNCAPSSAPSAQNSFAILSPRRICDVPLRVGRMTKAGRSKREG
jgi:hypothetical protein